MKLSTQTASCDIITGNVAQLLPGLLPAGRPLVAVIDRNIDRTHPWLRDHFTEVFLLDATESDKTQETVTGLHRSFISSGYGRDLFVVGIGGGITTDLTGYAASTYMRGVDFGFVPTTLLAQVDASIGGKNGVNIDGYKNMAGTFRQPSFVLCDPIFLTTLPRREFRSGMAEVIKAGIIADSRLLNILRCGLKEPQQPARTMTEGQTAGGATNEMTEIISRAVAVKCNIVSLDEHESGQRRLLNLGHTFGHAIEKAALGYSHGEAVAAGTVIATNIAVKLGLLNKDEADSITGLFLCYGLPVSVPVPVCSLLPAVQRDKKAKSGKIGFVLPVTGGGCVIHEMEIQVLADLIMDL